jgi:RNA polymerase sigma-70 factor (ECF subfamily)
MFDSHTSSGLSEYVHTVSTGASFAGGREKSSRTKKTAAGARPVQEAARQEVVAGQPAEPMRAFAKPRRSELDALMAWAEPRIRKQLLRYPLSEEDRDDVAQQALLQLARRHGTFRGDSSLSTWLFRLTANEVLMSMRSQRRRRARFAEGITLDDGDVSAKVPLWQVSSDLEGELLASERDLWVRGALQELPVEYQQVMMAHYAEDQGLQEIADNMQLTESAVRSRLHRARLKLRSLLEKSPERRAA